MITIAVDNDTDNIDGQVIEKEAELKNMWSSAILLLIVFINSAIDDNSFDIGSFFDDDDYQ